MAKDDIAFYHGTKASRASSILSHGLNTSRSTLADADRAGQTRRFAFLAKSPEHAEGYAKRHKRGVVLKITPDDKTNRQMVTNIGEYTRSPSRIPSKQISLHKWVEGDG